MLINTVKSIKARKRWHLIANGALTLFTRLWNILWLAPWNRLMSKVMTDSLIGGMFSISKSHTCSILKPDHKMLSRKYMCNIVKSKSPMNVSKPMLVSKLRGLVPVTHWQHIDKDHSPQGSELDISLQDPDQGKGRGGGCYLTVKVTKPSNCLASHLLVRRKLQKYNEEGLYRKETFLPVLNMNRWTFIWKQLQLT